MMMMLEFNSRRSRERTRYVLTALGIVVLLVVALVGPWVRDTLSTVLWGVAQVQQAVPLPRAVLESRLAMAEEELQQIQYQSILYAAQAERIQRLEKELALRPHDWYVSTTVLEAPPRSHYDTLLIAAGERDGVRVGDTASAYGMAVGIITDVSSATAIVQLFSSPGATRDAVVGARDAILIVTGLGGGALEAYAPGELAISVGDAVRDARGDYVFGTVASVVRREIDTEQHLLITVPIAPSALRLVTLTHPE
jgi:cell shape-determining protein MreC